MDQFLSHVRLKFAGISVKGDRDCLVGLPQPIHESVKVLKEVCIVSLNIEVEFS